MRFAYHHHHRHPHLQHQQQPPPPPPSLPPRSRSCGHGSRIRRAGFFLLSKVFLAASLSSLLSNLTPIRLFEPAVCSPAALLRLFIRCGIFVRWCSRCLAASSCEREKFFLGIPVGGPAPPCSYAGSSWVELGRAGPGRASALSRRTSHRSTQRFAKHRAIAPVRQRSRRQEGGRALKQEGRQTGWLAG